MTQITITEMSRNFSDFINRVLYKGEKFTIVRGKKPVAEISPVPAGRTLGDLSKILATFSTFTPEEVDDFEKDLADIRAEGNQEMLEDPWES